MPFSDSGINPDTRVKDISLERDGPIVNRFYVLGIRGDFI